MKNCAKIVEHHVQSGKKTFFPGSHITIREIFHFVLWIIGVKSETLFLESEIGLSRKTVVDWRSFVREIYLDWAIGINCGKIGGEAIIVEIDEAKVGKRKNNCGRIIEGQWVFGGTERGSRNFFLVPVPDRSSKTLVKIIKENIKDGTTIYSDCWKAYDRLDEDGFQHLTVNHSHNFVDPDSGAHTQNIERLWRDMKERIPKYGRRKENFPGYLAAFLFHKYFPDHREKFHHFFIAMGTLYNPKKQLNLDENYVSADHECKYY